MILKNLWRRPTRSLLTMLGIAIGVATVVALGAMAQGMIKNYGTAVGLSNDLLVIQANALDPLFSSLDEEMAQRIQAVPGVDEVDPGVYTWIVTDEMPFFLVFGYQPGSASTRPTIGSSRASRSPGRSRSPSAAAPPTRSRRRWTTPCGSTACPIEIVGIYETGQGMEESGGLVTLADAPGHRPEAAQGEPLSGGRAPEFRYRPGQAPHRIAGQGPIRQHRQRIQRHRAMIAGLMQGLRLGHRGHCHPDRRAGHDERDGDERAGAHARDRHAARARLAPRADRAA